ncbi:MAG: hypothetical protein EHM70_26490 [Chloroflexota bacterium]|nr:MAG: hypothetical protein EHM70_26490 [Chloroflexota bacterium]
MSRAAVSWGYADGWFPRNRSESKRIGRLWTAYHALYPGENVVRQMDNLFRVLGDEVPPLPLIEDWELVHGQTKYTITKAILTCDDIIERRTGRHMILYSRKNLLEQYTYFEELRHLDLHLAQYLSAPFPTPEHPGPPELPKGASTWRFHQTGDHTPGAGFGVESLQLDYDRFNGTVEELYTWAGFERPEPPAVPLIEWAVEADSWMRSQGYRGARPGVE